MRFNRMDNKQIKNNTLNNNGFTLVELLLSIAILAIMITPLLNNFVTSARISAKAKKMQNETILTQNILEEMKAKSIADIAKEFNYPLDFPPAMGEVYEVVPDAMGGYVTVGPTEKSSNRVLAIGEDGLNYYDYKFVEKKDKPYYFAKKNVAYGGRNYDALITMDGTSYIQTDPMNPSGKKIGYNTYEMPVISDINKAKNGVAVESFETNSAVADLYSNHIGYNVEQEALHIDDPDFSIPYYSAENIKDKLYREMKTIFIKNSDEIQVKIIFEYTCPSIDGTGSTSYTLVDKSIEAPMDSVFIFYYPTYSDSISVSKDSLISEDIDVYMVKQESSLIGSIPETVVGIIPDGIQVYSNASFGISSKELVKKDEAKNRIFNIKVQLYPAGSNFAANELCAEFSSTKEE